MAFYLDFDRLRHRKSIQPLSFGTITYFVIVHSVVNISLFLSDTALHLFLQTRLSVKQIEAYIRGELLEDVVRRAYAEAAVREPR